ncbi:MAG TPA: asparaginase [Rhizomicrobium sp.]|jgi:L-asparaginase
MTAVSTEEKPRICLLYTGGTIGMIADEYGVLRPPKEASDFLKIAPELPDLADIEFEELMNKDSTNMVPADWTHIANAIYERRNEGYNGFVIAHGTDTMHFTSSALAFAFGSKLKFPVVLTGAQTIPAIYYGDARINLLRAVRVASENLAEVVISFGDYVFRGCRTQKKDERKFDAFESPAYYPIADITEKILFHPNARRKKDAEEGDLDLQADFADGIVQVGLIPGLEPALLEPLINGGKRCRGIVLQSFGAGNVPNGGDRPEERKYAFGDFIQSAVGKGIPIVITSQFPANSTLETKYAPGVAAVEAGAIATGNMTSAAATVKFRWVLAQVEREIRQGMTMERDRLSRVKWMMHHRYILEMD